MLDTQPALVRQAIADKREPWYSAWVYFRDGRLKSALTKTPNVYAGGNVPALTTYTQLDTDGHLARNLAIGYSLTGDVKYAIKALSFIEAWAMRNKPVPFKATGGLDYQGGYHQSYGYFSFAFAYDLIRDSGAAIAGDWAWMGAWLRAAADALATYQDHWATKLPKAGARIKYTWCDLTEDARDYHLGRDTSICTLAAELACAVASRYSSHIQTLFDPVYPMNVPAILHAACAPDNQGDGVLDRVPNVQINAGLTGGSGAGGQAYMSYVIRMAALVAEMSNGLGMVAQQQLLDLLESFTYLSRFCSPDLVKPPCPGDIMPWADFLARMQIGEHLFGGFEAAVGGGQASPRTFYDIQYLGPVTLVQPGL